MPGRGAYLHDQQSCWIRGMKGTLAKALRTTISEQDLAALQAYTETLSKSNTDEDQMTA